jgi:CheY-like chemotaxis protein
VNDSSRREVLLVEDNPGDAALARKVIEELTDAVRVTVVPDGERAMTMLTSGQLGRPDLILLDLNLPRMSGHEVLAALKADSDLRAIPVVALTSSAADEDVAAAYHHRINAYVTKRADLDAYVEAMRCLQSFWFGTATIPSQPPGQPPGQPPITRIDSAG